MVYGLMIAFAPLFLGYLFLVRNLNVMAWINRITMYCLYLILFLMGVSLGQLDELATKLPQIGATAFGLSFILHSSNIFALVIFDKFYPMPRQAHSTEGLPSRWKVLLESAQLCLAVFIGGVFGVFTKNIIDFPLYSSTYVLIVMIFLVGIQLRNSGIPLKSVFLNKRGILTSLIFMGSGLIGGLIAAYVLDLPLSKSLALTSGFGWYSLSSVLINDAWGAVYGSIAFFNDLSREIFCLFAIPFFMQRYPSTAVGLGGATSLDATLPIIQKSGGIQVVPLAISFGFIINLVVPILMSFFIGL